MKETTWLLLSSLRVGLTSLNVLPKHHADRKFIAGMLRRHKQLVIATQWHWILTGSWDYKEFQKDGGNNGE